MIRQCVICGAEFDTPPSSNKRTCSPACSAAWRSQQHKGRHNKWSASAKRNAAAAAEKTGNLAHGTKAALALPEGQRGPQNRNAKIWHLRTPDNHVPYRPTRGGRWWHGKKNNLRKSVSPMVYFRYDRLTLDFPKGMLKELTDLATERGISRWKTDF